MISGFTGILLAVRDRAHGYNSLGTGRLLISLRKKMPGLVQQLGNVTKSQGPFCLLPQPQPLCGFTPQDGKKAAMAPANMASTTSRTGSEEASVSTSVSHLGEFLVITSWEKLMTSSW